MFNGFLFGCSLFMAVLCLFSERYIIFITRVHEFFINTDIKNKKMHKKVYAKTN